MCHRPSNPTTNPAAAVPGTPRVIDPLLINNNAMLGLIRIVADFTDAMLLKIRTDAVCSVDIEVVREVMNGPLRSAIQTFETRRPAPPTPSASPAPENENPQNSE